MNYECTGQIPPEELSVSTTAATTGIQVDGGFSAQENGLTDPCAAAGPQAEPMTVFIEREDQDAAVTVTNTFPEPPAAAPAVVIAPTFTG